MVGEYISLLWSDSNIHLPEKNMVVMVMKRRVWCSCFHCNFGHYFDSAARGKEFIKQDWSIWEQSRRTYHVILQDYRRPKISDVAVAVYCEKMIHWQSDALHHLYLCTNLQLDSLTQIELDLALTPVPLSSNLRLTTNWFSPSSHMTYM